ncbi:SigE family RNA polymerase sigma factor, partial [Allorhizocola rhizosphaerae]|uniref:SigE family RNA polymerase sigma factor n=1 Tax=Allorhizocola rhizosphaerae TaxID=1872709 RepID=UPI0013C2FB3A
MTSAVAQSDFDLFYEAHFGDTVAMTYGFTADLGEAQDIAQEAFCRAWLRWRELSSYDNPVAWVRRVATNLAHSRWRRLRVAATHLVRQREPEPVPAVNPDHVAVVAALRKLPAAQRRAVVLHHLMDLPVTEVAEQLEVPVGTVKSWLHRARTALADDLRVDVRGAVTTPPAQEVLDRAGRRRRARVATAAGAMVL